MAIHISRRDFIVTLGSAAAAWPLAARGQQPERVRRIGYLSPAKAAPIDAVFFEALRQLGWIEGNNASLEIRYAENDAARLARMADELVRLNVDVIVARGTLGPLAAKRATKTIPIVMASSGDPLGSGLVASLARPGGNVTGMSLMAPDLGGKRLEILKDMLPALSRVAILWNAANPYPAVVFRETESAARKLGVEIQSVEVRGLGDFDGALGDAVRHHPSALITVEDPLMLTYRNQIAEFAAKNRLPAIYGLREYVEAGGLMSYGANFPDQVRRAAGYVDKILKGANPADLPVEQPTKFELVINVTAAKAISLDVPPILLARADEVIE
ncbi:MAG: ABC transporter substrate-binding protein [Xanthobacteraceae bacterium]|jgi:putative ABC transport system substrate-binding protein